MTNIPNQPPSAGNDVSVMQQQPQKEVKVVSVTEQQKSAQSNAPQNTPTNVDPVPANMQAEYAQAQSVIDSK